MAHEAESIVHHTHKLLITMADEWCDKNMIPEHERDIRIISKKYKNASGNEFYRNSIFLMKEDGYVNIKLQIQLNHHTKSILMALFGKNRETMNKIKPIIDTL